MGIDKFNKEYNAVGKIWGWDENKVVWHEFMSTTMFNFQMSKFLCYLKSSEYDPFYPSIKLDFFNAYYLQMFMYHHEITYKRMLVKECEQNLFSELKLSTKWSSEKPS